MDIETLAKNDYLIFRRDYWIVLTAVALGLVFIVKHLLKINKIDQIEKDVSQIKKDLRNKFSPSQFVLKEKQKAFGEKNL